MLTVKRTKVNTNSRFDQRLTGRACSVVAAVMMLLVVSAPTAAQSWTQLAPTGGPPPVRIFHSAVHNPATNRMIVFGGLNGAGFVGIEPKLNDVWVLENADGLGGAPNWIQLFPTGGPPIARVGHSAVYDPATNRMTVFGGNPNFGNCFGTVNDLWVLENADGLGGTPTWTQLFPTGGPPTKRYLHSAVYDAATNRMIMFGGHDACGFPNHAQEVWVLTNANGLGATPTWTQLSPTGGPIPPGSANHAAIYDPATNRMTVSGAGGVGEVWMLEHANGLGGTPNWTQLLSPTGGPPFTFGGRGVYDPITNQMIVFGGGLVATGLASNEVRVLEHANGLGGTPNWTQLNPTPPGPERNLHSAIFNVTTNRMTIFAGHSNVTISVFNDVWVLTNTSGIVAVPEQIEQLIVDLQAIVDANAGTPLADKLEDALASVETGLDELNKEPPDNQAAVGNMEGAVGSICDAVVEEGLDPVQGTQLMDKLAGVARQLAVEAIDEAVAAGGDQDAIDEAEVSLIVGDALRELGNSGVCEAFKDAVNFYKDALAKAEGALP